MTSLTFPDLNVWMALSIRAHDHHEIARRWYGTLQPNEELAFCRMTQLGLLRLLTTRSASGDDTLTQRQAWVLYDKWLESGGARLIQEPFGLEIEFRFHTDRTTPSPKEWADSYLIAFAAAASLPLVTFDKALSLRYARSILLG